MGAGGRGALIYGFGRQGKSSLAMQVIKRMGSNWHVATLYDDYSSDALLDALNQEVRDEPLGSLIAGERKEALKNPQRQGYLLRRILGNENGVLSGDNGLLLVIDGFEQVLAELEGQGFQQVWETEAEFMRVTPEVFAEMAPKVSVRLLIASRYRFSLTGGDNRDMEESLIPVHAPPMKLYESLNQARAKRIKAVEETLIQDIAKATGERELLLASDMFRLPVPLATLAVLAKGLGLPEGESAVARLLSFGCGMRWRMEQLRSSGRG